MLARALAVALVIALALRTTPASANDRVAELSKMLSSSSNEKARLAAVVALARLGDKRALKPLVAALSDPHTQIRTVAAAALGKLGHKAALPALKGVATDDVDAAVRTSAKEAATLVAKANGLPSPWADAEPAKPTKVVRKSRPGFGNQPRALEPQAELCVLINSSMDDSPGKADKKMRQAHAEIMRAFLLKEFRANPALTTVATPGVPARHLDLSVTKLDTVTSGTHVEVEAQLRLAISDEQGKMLSFVSGGAKVSVPRKTFQARYMTNMRREALEGAMRGLYEKLVAQLRDRTQS